MREPQRQNKSQNKSKKQQRSKDGLTILQRCIFDCMLLIITRDSIQGHTHVDEEGTTDTGCPSVWIAKKEEDSLQQRIQQLPLTACPRSTLEKLGNDTLMLPHGESLSSSSPELMNLLHEYYSRFLCFDTNNNNNNEENQHYGMPPTSIEEKTPFEILVQKFFKILYSLIITRYNSNSTTSSSNKQKSGNKICRLVRKGQIDPNSSTRTSKCCILYHLSYPTLSSDEIMNVAASATPQFFTSPGWITVQEYGIRLSFDMTKLMYSRGNVTEKIRFAQECVQLDDVVLDMYAGIGYFTIPALILGKASHVHACEWNVDAVNALLYNVLDNGLTLSRLNLSEKSNVEDDHKQNKLEEIQRHFSSQKIKHQSQKIVTVYHADSRDLLLQNNHLVNAVDRVSLGLLPSSEGGWKTAVEALRLERGGWLHVHGNVPTVERKKWALWLCSRLIQFCQNIPGKQQWTAICNQVVTVKSFAPHIDHVVADVFVGPPTTGEKWFLDGNSKDYANEGIPIDKLKLGLARCSKDDQFDCVFRAGDGDAVVEPPSCALNPDGVLHQSWMMPIK